MCLQKTRKWGERRDTFLEDLNHFRHISASVFRAMTAADWVILKLPVTSPHCVQQRPKIVQPFQFRNASYHSRPTVDANLIIIADGPVPCSHGFYVRYCSSEETVPCCLVANLQLIELERRIGYDFN